MSEKSGLEMLEELIQKVNLLNKRFEVIEQNTKELMNRANGFEKSKRQEKPISPSEIGLQPVISSTVPNPIEGRALESKPKNTTKVIGKIKGKDNKYLSGVFVKVFNQAGEIVKETKTNRAGEWMSFLPPGRYGAEYLLENIIHANVNFNVLEGQKILRVAQPKE